MIFYQNREYNENEIQLVKNVLEKLVGRGEDFCRKCAEKNGFIFLDQWDDKMGFVKEEQNKYLILSLQFEDEKCRFYQLIVRQAGKRWLDGKIIDYNTVRKDGVIQNGKAL